MVRLDRISLAFIEPESGGNIGFLARTMKNFGVTRLVLVGGCPLDEDTWTFAMHAKDVIKRSQRVSWSELLSGPHEFLIGTTSRQGHDGNLPRVAISPNELATSLLEVDGDVCLAFGREGNGLSLQELEACDLVVRVPTSPEYPALNVSHAAAVILYEIYRVCEAGPRVKMRTAVAEEKAVLLNAVRSMIDSSNLPPHRRRSSELVFRRLVNRAFISGRECHTLIGLMKDLAREGADGSQPPRRSDSRPTRGPGSPP
jgi:TrmH family RNA methyltransferase